MQAQGSSVDTQAVHSALSECIFPPLSIDSDGKIDFPEKFSVRIGGSAGLYNLLRSAGKSRRKYLSLPYFLY